VVRAGTLHDLAVRLGVDANRLIATVAKHNEYAVTGIDLDFRKGTTIYNRSNGDLAVKPNHNLKALEKPPFYALPVTPATFGTSIGLKTNENAQVLAADGLPILGLYAVGTDMTSVMRGLCPGGGIALGPALVFAYRAALNAAKSSGRESRTCK
jgi:3-oxosteroid 1-dehydrogenase